VWIGGNGAPDSQILKFTKDGKFLMQVGKQGARRTAGAKPATPGPGAEGAGAGGGFAGGSNDQISFGRVAKIFVDPRENEAFIADGYLNKRVAVLDADTGKMKRWWGAYGNKPGRHTVAALRSGCATGPAVPQPRPLCRPLG
jgi:hypothetical protein